MKPRKNFRNIRAKKLTAILLLVSMAVIALSGCSDDQEQNKWWFSDGLVKNSENTQTLSEITETTQ